MGSSYAYGSTKDGNPWQSSCPAGTVLRGIAYRSGSAVDDITSLFCAPPASPVSGSDISVAVVAADDSGGTAGTYKCPDNTAVAGIAGQIDGDNKVGQLALKCRNFKTGGAAIQGAMAGKNTKNAYNYEAPFPWYATGLAGRAGKNLDAIQMIGGNFADPIHYLTTDDGIANGCMGLGDPNWRLYQPQSADCDKFMVQNFCQKNPSDPRCSCVSSEMTCPNKFDKSCISQNGYRTNDMMKAACPNIMNCVQYLALSPGAQQLATNTEQNCSTNSSNSSNINTSNSNTTVTGEADSSFWIWVIIIVLVMLMGMVGGAIYYFTRSDDIRKKGAYELTEAVEVEDM